MELQSPTIEPKEMLTRIDKDETRGANEDEAVEVVELQSLATLEDGPAQVELI